MFLIDTNCWIQLVRERSQADEVRQMLSGIPTSRMAVSVYSVHSIGIIMLRFGMLDRYAPFLDTASIGTGIRIVNVPVRQLGRVAGACAAHGLDFDDAFQYAACELHDLKIVSLDADFDRTPRGRLTPGAALAEYKQQQQRQQ